MSETLPISAYQKAWTKMTMYLNSSTNDAIGDPIIIFQI